MADFHSGPSAPIEQVWAVIADSSRDPDWWKYVASVDALSSGDEQGMGRTQRTNWTTALLMPI